MRRGLGFLAAVLIVGGGFWFAAWHLDHQLAEPENDQGLTRPRADGAAGGGMASPSPVRSRPFTGEEESGAVSTEAGSRVTVPVSFRMIEAGELAQLARGTLDVLLRKGPPVTVKIEAGRSVRPVPIPEGHHGMTVRIDGRARRTGWSFDVLAGDGEAQIIDVNMPPGGVRITGVATDGAGGLIPMGTSLLFRLAGTFSAPVPNPQWPDVHKLLVTVGEGGRWSYELEGSVSRAALGVWRTAGAGEVWAFFPTPYMRALLREGEAWDVGRHQVTEIPVLLTATVSKAPDVEVERPFSLRWEFAPPNDPRSPRGFGLGAEVPKGLDAPLRLLGQPDWNLFEVSVNGCGFSASARNGWFVDGLLWRSREPVALGSHVRVLLERPRRIAFELDLPHPPPSVQLGLWREGRLIEDRVIAYGRGTKSEGRFLTRVELQTCSGNHSVTLAFPFTKAWRRDDVIIPDSGPKTVIDLGTVRLGDDWSRVMVTVKDAEGASLESPEARVVGPGGEATYPGRGDGTIWIPVPSKTRHLLVWIAGRGHVPQLHPLSTLPSVVRLERGAFVSVEPGFDPTEIAWPGGVRVSTSFEMESAVPTSPVEGKMLDVDSALGVTFGPLPPGSVTFWMHLAYERAGGQTVVRAWKIGSLEITASSEDLDITAPESIHQGIRDQLAKEAGK